MNYDKYGCMLFFCEITDVDHCSEGTFSCPEYALCVNSPDENKYMCECQMGYAFEGEQCKGNVFAKGWN